MDVGCVLIPHYPAWTLLRRGAESPLVVVDGGRVAAVGPDARRCGVERGVTTGRAQTLAPEATVLPRDPALEAATWEEVDEALNATTPYVERDRPGCSFVRPHDTDRLRAVVDRIGAHAGLGPTRTDAELAARKAVSGEMLEIRREHVEAFRRKLPVARLAALGVPEDVTGRLDLFGYDTVAAAATLSERHLKAQFGDAGARLYALLHGTEETPVSAYAPPPSIERSHRFEHPESEPGPLKTAVSTLLEDAVEELGGQAAQRITIRLQGRDHGRAVTSRTLREPQDREHALRSAAHTLLDGLLTTERRVDELTVELGALQEARGTQANLFFERPAVRKAVAAVHERYPGVLQRAVLVPEAVFPENRVRYEPAS